MASVDVQQTSTLGFSVQTARFQTLGLHPELLTRVPGLNAPNLATGTHDQLQYGDFSDINVQKRREGPNWQHALYTEQMAKIPHSSFKETYETRKENERRVGPGTYNIDDFLTENERKPRSKRGNIDHLTPRFAKDLPDRAPPPGAYGISDEKIIEHHWQQGSNIPSFEWNQGPRTLPLQGSKIGPGTYNIKGSIDEVVHKRVGEKGPYQVFSINRAAPIMTGHYAVLDSWDLSPDFPSKDYPDSESFVRDLGKNKKKGMFSKLERFPKTATDRIAIEHPGLQPKNVDFPGPQTYNVTRSWDPKDFHKKNIPFNSSSTRNDKRSFIYSGGQHPVGVGRYNLLGPIRDETIADKRKRPKRRNIGFLSTTGRFPSSDGEALLNERLQPQNLRSEQRTQLYLSGRVSS